MTCKCHESLSWGAWGMKDLVLLFSVHHARSLATHWVAGSFLIKTSTSQSVFVFSLAGLKLPAGCCGWAHVIFMGGQVHGLLILINLIICILTQALYYRFLYWCFQTAEGREGHRSLIYLSFRSASAQDTLARKRGQGEEGHQTVHCLFLLRFWSLRVN